MIESSVKKFLAATVSVVDVFVAVVVVVVAFVRASFE